MRPSSFRILAILLVATRGAAGVDSALVQLESESTEVEQALLDIVEGRYREGIETLEAALARDSRPGERRSALMQVPQDLPRDAAALHAALRQIASSPRQGAAPGPGSDEPDEDGRAPPRPIERRPQGLAPQARPFARSPALAADSPLLPGRRYLPRADLASTALLCLPPEGLRVYRELYDSLAAKLLATYRDKGDVTALERVARELFLSSSGDDAVEIVGDRFLEEASYRQAMICWRQALLEHPASDVPASRLVEKLLHASRLLGDEKEYLLERRRFLEVRPGDSAFVEALEKHVVSMEPGTRGAPVRSSRWGGELDASAPPRLALPVKAIGAPAVATNELRLSWDSWGWALTGIEVESSPVSRRVSSFNQWPSDEPVDPYFPFVPLVDGTDLYLSGVFSLFRFDARPGDGSLTSQYPKPTPSTSVREYVEQVENDSPLYTTTLWKKALDADSIDPGLPDEVLVTSYISDRVLPRQFMSYSITVDLPIRSLIAFDAQRGNVLWKTGEAGQGTASEAPGRARPGRPRAGEARGARDGARAAPDDDDDMFPTDTDIEPENGARPRLRPGLVRGLSLDDDATGRDREFSYTSPAIVKAGRVVAGGWVQRGYVNSALRCHDLRTGALLWETLLSGFQVEPTMFGEMAREPFAGAILEDGGTVYYVDQGGVAAAVELETGRVKWLTTYDVIEVEATLAPSPILRKLSWGANPLCLVGHVLVAAPRDSEHLFAFDAGTGPDGPRSGGKTLWHFSNSITRDSPMATAELRDLLGAYKGLLYFTGPGELRSGPSVVAALDLTGMDAHGQFPGGGSPVRLAPLRAQGKILGAGVLTTAGVLFSDEQGLQLASLDLRNSSPVGPRPYRKSERGSYPGRLQVADGLVIMTSRDLLSAFALLPLAESR